MTRTAGAAIPHLLTKFGVDVVFGIPGVQTLEFFRGIGDSNLRHVLSRSEQGAVFSADGYARTSGKPGVVLLISGPGLTNAATAIAQAHRDSIPLLVISAAPPSHQIGRNSGALHELPNQQAFMATITAYSWHASEVSEIPGLIAHAFEFFSSERPRPVHIQLPANLFAKSAGDWPAAPPTASAPRPAAADIEAAAELLRGATRPLIIAGGGAASADTELKALAEFAAAPVALTMNAKGLLPDTHPLTLSTTLPTEATLDAIRQADVVVAVGTEFSEVDYYYAATDLTIPGQLIRIDIDPGQLQAEFPAAVGLGGDSARTLATLTELLGPAAAERTRAAIQWAQAVRAGVQWWDRALPLLPLVEAIGSALPDDVVLASDSTQLGYIGQHAWQADKPRSWMVPACWGTLGYALPMAIGAAVASPRPVACVVGDGGVLFTIGEMATAADLGRSLVMVLWNNHGYGEMRDEFAEAGIRPVGTEAAAADYAKIAEGFGWVARRPRELAEVGGAVSRAFDAPGPTLIELTPELL